MEISEVHLICELYLFDEGRAEAITVSELYLYRGPLHHILHLHSITTPHSPKDRSQKETEFIDIVLIIPTVSQVTISPPR
jgi:hypothetical protein